MNPEIRERVMGLTAQNLWFLVKKNYCRKQMATLTN